MKLFLKKHVRKQSYEKWGGKEGLQKEIMKRNQHKFKVSLEKNKDALKLPFYPASETSQGVSHNINDSKKKRKKSAQFMDLVATIRGDKTI